MSTTATIEHIFLRPVRGKATLGVSEASARAGEGLDGDHGCPAKDRDREVTLIESEALDALARECGITLPPSEARRNLVTRGVALNHLVGREFTVGGVTLRGMRLCEPCDHLQQLTQPGVLAGLVHRGGLRAAIVHGGAIRVGDAIIV